MKTQPPAAPSSPFAPASLAAARQDTPPLLDPGPQLRAAREAFADESAAAAPRWTDDFASLFGSARALAICAVFTLGIGSVAASQAATELSELTTFLEFTAPLWEVSS
jgi:hypothetical protein